MEEVERREKERRRGVNERTDKGGNSNGKKGDEGKKWRGERRGEKGKKIRVIRKK